VTEQSLVAFADRLRAQGVIATDAPAPPEEMHDRPWFIALLQGVAGWVAGMLLMIFIGVVADPESRTAFLLLGALLLATAWAIYHTDPDAVFLDQLALALSFAGQISLVIGLVYKDPSALVVALVSLVVQLGVLVAMSNRTARTFAALLAGLAWIYAVRYLLRPVRAQDIFDRGFDDVVSPLGAWMLPVGWLLTWGPLIALTIWLIRNEPQWMTRGWRKFARPMLTGFLVCAALGGAATEPFAYLALGAETWGLHFSWHALFPLLSVALSLFAAYGAFRVRSTGLLGLAIVGALINLMRFSYFYGTTLLMKSLILLCLGAFMLLMAAWLQRRFTMREAA
jgi:hypothetical protein